RRRRAARDLGGLDDAFGPRRGHHAGRDRAARRVHGVPPARPPGQDGRHARRGQRRPLHAGARCRLERDGVRRLRPGVRSPRRTLRGSLAHHRPAGAARPGRVPGRVSCHAGLRDPPARPAAGRTPDPDRGFRPSDAASGGALRGQLERRLRPPPPPPPRGSPPGGPPPRRGGGGGLAQACAEVGRDPATLAVTAELKVAYPDLAPAPPLFADRYATGSAEDVAATFHAFDEAGFATLMCTCLPNTPQGVERLGAALEIYRRVRGE